MRILYGFSNCTDKKYNEIMRENNKFVLRPDQTYHGLLIKGLASNGAEVKCFSGLPINRKVTKKLFIHSKDEIEDGVSYHYYKTVNLPIIRQLSVFLSAFISVLFTKKKKDDFIICDCLNIANAYGMLIAGKLKKIPVITIVTDIPDFMYCRSFIKIIANNFFKLADGFILLTEAMNSRVNPNSKPHIVIEGLVDPHAPEINATETNDGVKRIIYSGGLNEIYGIKNLVEGFILANLDDTELLIYGDGDYVPKLKEMTKKHKSIKYMGVCDKTEVVKAQCKAALLVNPRPTAPEYTKYSFPSKNTEYMVSGTPVLTTKLSGMPDEYLPYIFLIEDETPLGISDALRGFFKLPLNERNTFGKRARKFVIENKSNIHQANKIISFLQNKF